MSKAWNLGITGGIGSGKTRVATLFSDLGIEVVDADIVARSVVEPDTEALEQIVSYFGQNILLANKQLNRTALRHIIFTDPAKKYWLEQLLHPIIRQEISLFLKKAESPYAILVSPLLFESNQHQLVDRVLVVDTPESLQLERSIKRDNSTSKQIQTIIRSQLPREERLNYADDIIVNDKDLHHLEREVKRLHQFYLTLKKGR